MRRSSHADYVTVPADQVTRKPSEVPWEVAGSLFVAGTTAYAAVRAMRLQPGETVAIAGAAGGVGSIAVQLAKRAGATVLGIAGPSNDAWLTAHGAVPVNYGDELRRSAADGITVRPRRRIPRLLRRGLCRNGCREPRRRAGSGEHDDGLRCRRPVRRAIGGRGRTPRPPPSSRSWRTSWHATNSKCRSPASSRWTMCAMRIVSSNHGTPTARSCCARNRPDASKSCAPARRSARPARRRGRSRPPRLPIGRRPAGQAMSATPEAAAAAAFFSAWATPTWSVWLPTSLKYQ